MFSLRFCLSAACAVVLAVLPCSNPAWSQTSGTTGAGSQKSPPAKPTAGQEPSPTEAELLAQGLNPTAVTVENLGLTINLPRHSKMDGQKIDGVFSLVVSDEVQPPTWTMRISSIVSSLENPTARGQILDHLEKRTARNLPWKEEYSAAVTYGGVEGHLSYIYQNDTNDEFYMAGWLILPNGPQSFLVFSIVTSKDDLERLRPILEASFKTIKIRSATEIADEARGRIETSKRLLSSLTPERLKTLVGSKQWARIYQPAGTTKDGKEAERGYSYIEILEGKKGLLNPNRPENSYTPDEKTVGLVVKVTGRQLVSAEKKAFYDFEAIYWMAWDQSSETWSIRATQKQGEAELSEAETGVRSSPAAGSILTVIRRTSNSEPVTYNWDVPEAYLSQALGQILGRVMPTESSDAREYTFYYYVASEREPKVLRRIDEWGPAPDGSGHWALTTRITSDAPPFVSTYSDTGAFIQRVYADGSITEPIELNTLFELWKRKGLPVSTKSR